MEQINKKHFYSKQKGRALSMLVTDKEIYKINKKRKKEYPAYEPTIEESKKYKSKRLKPLNYDSVIENRKNIEWKWTNWVWTSIRRYWEIKKDDDNNINIDKPKYII